MFQIILTSDSSSNNYPENAPGCFKADLGETLNFNFGQLSWEVALSELFLYPKSWDIIREPFNFFHFSVEKFLYEPLEKRFYRVWAFDTVRANDDRAEEGNAEIILSGCFSCDADFYFSWRTFRGLNIHYKDFPDPGIQNDKWIEYADWPPKGGRKPYWYYRPKYPGPNRIKQYPYTEWLLPIPPGTYTAQDLVQYMSDKCRETLTALLVKLEDENDYMLRADYTPTAEDLAKPMIPYKERANGTIEFGFTWRYEQRFKAKIRLPIQISCLLGISSNLNDTTSWAADFYGTVPPNPHLNLMTSLYVFCDIIRPSYFNDKLIPLLRQITFSEASGQQLQHESFNNLFFNKISKSSVNTIKIWFSEHPSGYPIFQMLYPSTIVLLFRTS